MPKVKVSHAKKVRLIIKDFKEFAVKLKDRLYCQLFAAQFKNKKRLLLLRIMLLLSCTKKALRRQILLESRIRDKHLPMLINYRIFPKTSNNLKLYSLPLVKLNQPATVFKRYFQIWGKVAFLKCVLSES